MKKYLYIFTKVVFTLILLLPVVGSTGLLGEATRDLYNTDQAFAFIQALNDVMYITYMMTVVHIIAIIALWTRRDALASLIEVPISLNVVAFHLFLDGGLFTEGAVVANVMLLLNLYLLWVNRAVYMPLLRSSKAQA